METDMTVLTILISLLVISMFLTSDPREHD